MKKVSIIYWSSGGNVEHLANYIAEGITTENIEVSVKHVNDATIEDVLTADAVAFGSPAMVEHDIEKLEMKPFIEELREHKINNIPAILFGSCGWREDKFIHLWNNIMGDYGFNVIDKLVIGDSLKEEEIARARKLGKKLSKLC